MVMRVDSACRDGRPAGGPRSAVESGARLALVHYTAPPVVGGVEAIIASHVTVLGEAGHDVVTVVGRGAGTVVPELDSRHPVVEAVTAGLGAGTAIAEAERLAALLGDRLRPLLAGRDLVIAHNLLTMPFNLPLTAALLDAGLPIVAWTHDIAASDPRYRGFRRPGWPYALIDRPQPGVTYVAVSEARRRELGQALGLPIDEITVVPNGIDPHVFGGLSSAARRLLLASDALEADPLLLVPQRVTRGKRLELVLDAAAELLAEWPMLRVLVTGPLDPHSPDCAEYAERLLARRAELGLEIGVCFAFELPSRGLRTLRSQTVAELYRVADAAMVTSGGEGFGLPILEAAAARLPLVCTDIPVLRDIGGDGIFTFPARGGGSAVADAIRRALDSPAVQQRRRMLTEYSWRRVRPRLEAVIQAALRRWRGRAPGASLVRA